MTRGEKVIRFIETFCRVPEGKLIGQPLVLIDFEREFILAIYDNPAGTAEAILSIARKNGKTALIACLLLAHIVGPESRQNSQIVSGAMSRDQASLVFKLAVKMINLNPQLQDRTKVIPSSKTIIGLPLNVEYRALAAEGKTTHGLSPVLAILDEIGQVKGPQDDFVDAVTTAQGAYDDALRITISTQAAEDGDLLSIWIDDALASDDPKIVVHLHAADKDAELLDQKQWKKANPALGIFRSEVDMMNLAKKASRLPSSENTFRNLNLNQRISTVAPFISRDVWKGNGADPGPLDDYSGLSVAVGLDLSGRKDLCAMVVLATIEGRHCVWPYFWTPEEGVRERAKRDRAPYDVWVREGFLRTTPGRTVDYEHVAVEMGEILGHVDIETIGYDRWRIELLRKELERIGLHFPLVEFGQGYKDMSPALDTLEAALLNDNVAHGNHPVLTMCAANAIVSQDPAGNRKLDKHKATGRIDGMVAMAMAFGVGSAAVAEPELEIEVW